MKIDGTQRDEVQTTREGDRQNRREFFNGLGKWSMAVVAAIAFLRGSGGAGQARLEETHGAESEPERPAWAVSDDGRDGPLKVARKPYRKSYDKSDGGPGGGYAKDHANIPPASYVRYWKTIK